MNLTELDEARGVANYHPSARLKQSSALVGDVAARDYIRSQYRDRARQIVMRRANNVPVFDHLYEVGRGEYVIAEGKANRSPMGRTNRTFSVFEMGVDPLVAEVTEKKAVVQFSPEWFEQRLKELRTDFGPDGKQLAKRLEHAWHEGKIRALIIRTPKASMTAEHVIIEDVSRQWNDYLGVESRHTMPVDRRPRAITDPARLLAPPPTDVDRGLEATARQEAHVPHAEPHLSRPRLATAEHLGEGALKAAEHAFEGRALLIGVKGWRAVRTIGKLAIVCFVPLRIFDVVLEVALALWDRHREKEARKRREKQRALETVFKADKDTKVLQKGIQQSIVENRNVQAAFMNAWDNNKGFTGFQYARLHAALAVETYRDMRGEDSESLTTYRLTRLVVIPTSSSDEFKFEVEDIGEEKEVEKTDEDIAELVRNGQMYAGALRKIARQKRVSYTIVPPLLTPYDIVVTKINNLFLDIAYVCAQFSSLGDGILESFQGFNYTYRWNEQFNIALEFPHPLNADACEYCLAYLHYAAKQLSRHPLEQADLEGNLEDPRKGWMRRFWLLKSLLEGTSTQHGKNFSDVAQQVKGLVKRKEQTSEVAAALDQLFIGARAILYDLEHIEREIQKPEYFYLGPEYTPPE